MYKELNADEFYEVFHNAAEGRSWYAEAVPRQACRKEYKEICQEYKNRGLEIPKGNYLI